LSNCCVFMWRATAPESAALTSGRQQQPGYQQTPNVKKDCTVTESSVEKATWSPAEAEELYAVKTWSSGFFAVSDKGHVVVRPIPGSELEIDVTEVIDAALQEGCTLPLIIRFQDIIRARV